MYASTWTSSTRYVGALSSVQVHSVFVPLFSGGAACLVVPGRYWLRVALGTVLHASGTDCTSPGRNVVTSEPKPRLVELPEPENPKK